MSDNWSGWEKGGLAVETPEKPKNEDRREQYYNLAEDLAEVKHMNYVRKKRWPAFFGVVIVLLALLGVFAVGKAFVDNFVSNNNEKLTRNVEAFIKPISMQGPKPFENVAFADKTVLLRAAVWKVTYDDYNNQISNNTKSRYEKDDAWRSIVPMADVTRAYKQLFGSGAEPNHQTLGGERSDFNIEYDPAAGFYHVPLMPIDNGYTTTVLSISVANNIVSADIGFVPNEKIVLDKNGAQLEISSEDVEYVLTYILEKSTDDFVLMSIVEK